MKKDEFVRRLKSKGYRIEGNKAYLDTPYGVWVSEIVVTDPYRIGLQTIYNPALTEGGVVCQ